MRSRHTSPLAVAVLCVLLVALTGGPALAHAEFSSAEPAPGSNLTESPDRVRLTFSEPVDAEFDPVRVIGLDGERADDGDARVAPYDDSTVEVGLEDLPEGTYTVEYRVTSVDGHVIADSYQFTVAPPAEETTTAAAEPKEETTDEPAMEPTREALPETETTGGGSSPFVTIVLVGLAVLGLAALTVAVLRTRGRS
jgi:methionine-rich copper-binding protein CopC